MGFLAPDKGKAYETAPWGWSLTLLLVEFAIGSCAALISYLLGFNQGGSTGIISALMGSYAFAHFSELRSPGVMQKKVLRQVAFRTSALAALLGTLSMVPVFLGQQSDLPLWTIGVILVVSFLLCWLLHFLGLRMGARLAKRIAKTE